ncbi:LysR substrate-binding domain-containing protein [Actinopolymorpha sp. B11F2]|uniref:LysR substrate-binding domain-containing protein n=1 Tax=Actinopolymorpha sp. B11F2 TaxID=3160862 RepID=UPI0032E396EF
MLDVWSLRVLIEVSEQGSFSAAAASLSMTQPAISRQIAGLEQRLRVRLFRRVPRGVVPTSAGSVAVDLARDVLGRLRAMEASLDAYAGLDAGQLRLSAFASANTSFVPEAIRQFSDAHPGVSLSLVQADPSGPLPAVREGRVDLALVTAWELFADPHAAKGASDRSQLALQRQDGVELVPLLDEDLRLALSRDHPLARQRRVRLADLRTETWIEGAHPDCLGPIVPLAEALGDQPRVAFVCDDWNGKQALVAAGVGISLVPSLASGAIHSGVVLRRTTPALPTRRLYAAVAEPPFRPPAVTAMLAVLTALATGHEPSE